MRRLASGLVLWIGTSIYAQQAPLPEGLYSEITTEAGTVVAELYFQKVPMTVANFVGLAEGTLGPVKGQPFYDGLTWHRVVANFVVQGGDGMSKYEQRLEYSFPDEIVPGLRHDGPGTLQMANSGPDTNGSQYCFMLSDQTGLNYNHTVFGKVVRGLEVLPQIKQGDTMKVKILRVGEAAKGFKADEATFQALMAKGKRYAGPRTAGPEAFLNDPDNVVGNAGRGANFLQFKLANFERFTGERIVARVWAHTPEEARGEKLEGWLRELAVALKVAERGALVVYLQDQEKWIVRVGKGSEGSFIAGPLKADGTKDPVPAGRTLEAAMEEFMGVVMRGGRGGSASGPAATAPAGAAPGVAARGNAEGAGPAGTQRGRGRGAPGAPGVAQRLGVVLDHLIFRLEPVGKG